jgi:hypothetical protein
MIDKALPSRRARTRGRCANPKGVTRDIQACLMDPGLIGDGTEMEGNFAGFDGICRYRIDLYVT